MNPNELSDMFADTSIEDCSMDEPASDELCDLFASSSMSDIECDEEEEETQDRCLSPFAGSNAGSSDTDVSMRSSSPTPSIIEMTESIRAASFQIKHGRVLNTRSDVYALPADDDEFERLDDQHAMFKKIMGDYPEAMQECMRFDRGFSEQFWIDAGDEEYVPSKHCLDVGFGSAVWLTEVSNRWPASENVGIDLIPCQHPDLPMNARTEIDDINLGIAHFGHIFDAVNARLVSTGVRDFFKFIDDCASNMSERGLLSLMEYSFETYDCNKQLIEVDFSVYQGPWLPRWMAHINQAVRRRGGDVDAAEQLETWVNEHPSFEDVEAKEHWVETAPYFKHTKKSNERYLIADAMRNDLLAFVNSAHPLLMMDGLHPRMLADLEARVRHELLAAETPGFVCIHTVNARRRNFS